MRPEPAAPVAEAPATPVPAAPAARDRLPLYQRVWFQRTVTWGLLLVAWELFARRVGPFFFPSLSDVADGFRTIVGDGSLGLVAESFTQMLVGFGIAVLIGVPVGLLMGTFRPVEFLLGPYVNALFVTSLAAMLPFIILVFGTGFEFRVAVVALFAIFYVTINPANGVRSIDPAVLEMARSFNIGPVKRFVSITLPGTLPFIIAGLRLGLGQAVQGMIIAELWVTIGTGRKLTTLGLDRNLGEFFALAAVIVLVGTALTQSLMLAQRRFTPWSGDVASSVRGAN
ncbi:ABC transporter permease [Jiangella sp. DSM 45060]|uniref:ABC transporter permease n=1 Tax=Jiangella sp. DSM 45060 TaxID=1798224 RepID=UPI00087B4216|nr:ABC transporter permease subunit [Jiangella sp. DSM 45060]SDT66937.1 NitT/TauT family transport system permease protein [Jiangella sp. DSM 45060]